MKYHALALGALLAMSAPVLHAGCCAHHDAQESHDAAQAIGDYRIIAREEFADPSGHIFTRYTAELNDALKGKAPGRLEFRAPGGRQGNVVEYSSLSQDLNKGDDYILHLKPNAAGELSPQTFQTHPNRGSLAEKKALRSYFRSGARGTMPVAKQPLAPSGKDEGFSGVPGSVVTSTGYSHVTVNNIAYPSRFTSCDGGFPIPYLVDVDPAKLPPGMTSQEALDAVAEALGTWSSASSLKFRYAGTQSFGQSPANFLDRDGFIRIQLHDTYNYVTEANVAGTGGGRMTADPDVRPGGSIGGQGFHERYSGFVVLEHDLAFMDDVANFKQVLTHELGHALGLAHSSNNPSEPDAILKNATMYYKASNDGRGAALTIYDEDRIAYGYPLNTPPYLPDRFFRSVSKSSTGVFPPPAFGINRYGRFGDRSPR